MGWWQRYLRWRQRNVGALTLTETGFEVNYRGKAIVRWQEVDRVTAFKADLFTTDLLCLAFERAGKLVQIDEQMQGYAAVEAMMHERLGCSYEWKLRVLFPAFATNPEIIFDRRVSDT